MERELPHKYGEKAETSKVVDAARGASGSPIYLIGFLIIMLFALILHFIPGGSGVDSSAVEPHVEPAPL